MNYRQGIWISLLCCSLGACYETSSVAERAVEPVVIGFAAPLTGPQAHYGKSYQQGVQLAIDDINASQPNLAGKAVKFVLAVEDDQADPRVATQVAQKFVDAKVAGVIGHFNSGTSIPASKIYAEAGIAQIAMASSPLFTRQGYKTTFRALASDSQQGQVVGHYAVKRMGAQRVAVIDDRSAYGQGLADEFSKAVKAAGALVVTHEFTQDKATDFSAVLTKIKSVKPDLLFFAGGSDAQAALIVRQMRQLGLTIPFVSGDTTRTDSFIRLANTYAEGVIVSLPGMPLEKMPGGLDFAQRYRAKYGSMESYTPYGYDSTRLLATAMLSANSAKPVDYLPVLANLKYSGVTASAISYDTHGDLQHTVVTLYRVVNGEWQTIEIIT